MSDMQETPVEDVKRLEVDLSVYLPLFEDDSVSDTDKMALLEALWSIMMSFAQIGWGVHPVQQAQESRRLRDMICGKAASIAGDEARDSAIVIESVDQFLIPKFLSAADSPPQEAKKP